MIPISFFRKKELSSEWVKLPIEAMCLTQDEIPYHCSYFNNQKAIHLLGSVKKYGRLELLHVSLTPILTLRPNTPVSDQVQYVLENAAEVLKEVFPGMTFARQPDDERRPHMKHFFAPIEMKL